MFLLDEPLSNLDAKLRASARKEIKQFQQRVGTTTIYVTHDQVEAMGMGDRIAVIDHGQIRQVGTPDGDLRRPGRPLCRDLRRHAADEPGQLEGGYLGFRPENFLPKEMIDERAPVTEFRSASTAPNISAPSASFTARSRASNPDQMITAKLPPAHVADESIRPGEWHPFAVRNSALRYFDKDGKRAEPPLKRGFIDRWSLSPNQFAKPASRFRFILDRREVLGPLFVAPAILYVLLLVGMPFLLAVYYSRQRLYDLRSELALRRAGEFRADHAKPDLPADAGQHLHLHLRVADPRPRARQVRRAACCCGRSRAARSSAR